ncbi:MAG: ABC transporter ATP-binding protein [Acidimicrobiales bacterium]
MSKSLPQLGDRRATTADPATPADPVVAVAGAVKRFGATVALDGLDLTLRQGEILGFLGPNGAGKTTTTRALLGQIRLTAGTAHVFGRDAWSDAVAIHRRLASVPGDVALWPGLTGGECIDVLTRLHGGADPAVRAQLLERFELDPTKRSRTYSKGNRQKVALVAALAVPVELLILDEPTAGLDPLMEAQFQEVVRERAEDGVSVLLSSHILDQVEALCDRVAIVRNGRIIRSGSLVELRSQALTTVQATVGQPHRDLAELDGVDSFRADAVDGRWRLSARVSAEALDPVVRRLLDDGGGSLVVQPPTLDELFLDEYRGAGAATP